MAVVRTTVCLGADEARFLAGHLRRLTGWDERAAVRLLTRGQAVAVVGSTPMGAMSFIAVPTAASPPLLDTVVSAGRLRDLLGDVASGSGARDLVVPDDVGPVADLAVLPPDGPWIPAERATAGDVTPLVVAAIERFRADVAALPAGSAAAEDLAERTWDTRTWGGLPLRALHAARSLGLLNRDAARVESATCAGWKRLRTPAGQVFVRPVGAVARLSLTVLG